MAGATEEEIDPLDAYMASLELPSASAATAARAPASPVLTAIDWSTARRRISGVSVVKPNDDIDETQGATTAISSAVVKNRRYRRLLQLLEGEKVAQDLSQPGAMEANPDDWYFSDAMIQQRNPALFHFHVGQYLPGSAEEAAKAAAASSDAQQANIDSNSSNSDAVGPELLLSSFLLSTNDRREMETRRAFEQRSWGKFTGQDEKDARAREKALFQQEVEEEDEFSSDEEDEEEEMKQSERHATAATEQDALSIAERRQLLVDLMIHRFLQGSDHEYVDYAVIDNNAALDDLEQMQRDAEDAYFDMGDE